MKTGTFFVRVWRTLSIAGLLFALFNSYISYPGEVAVRFDDLGTPIQYVQRETLFYIAVAIFLINNTLIRAVGKLFLRVPSNSVPVPNQALWAKNRSQLNEIVMNWFSALQAAINTILGLALMVISFLNRSDRGLQAVDYAWLMPMSAFILISVLVALPVRMAMKPAAEYEG